MFQSAFHISSVCIKYILNIEKFCHKYILQPKYLWWPMTKAFQAEIDSILGKRQPPLCPYPKFVISIPESQKRARGERISLSDAINGPPHSTGDIGPAEECVAYRLIPTVPIYHGNPSPPSPGLKGNGSIAGHGISRVVACKYFTTTRIRKFCYALTCGKNRGLI